MYEQIVSYSYNLYVFKVYKSRIQESLQEMDQHFTGVSFHLSRTINYL